MVNEKLFLLFSFHISFFVFLLFIHWMKRIIKNQQTEKINTEEEQKQKKKMIKKCKKCKRSIDLIEKDDHVQTFFIVTVWPDREPS